MTLGKRFTTRVPIVAAILVFGSMAGCGKKDKEVHHEAAANPANHVHDGADETCFICDPAKRDQGRLWCREHARYEDRCWLCQPQLRDPDRLYCDEHGLYEDECFLCDPARAPKSEPSGARTEPVGEELHCAEHNVPERQCGICQPQFADTLEPGESLLIRLASERALSFADLSFTQAVPMATSATVPLLGELRYDGNQMAAATPRTDGIVSKVLVDVGERVRKGQVLAVVHAPEIASATAQYIATKADLELRKATHARQSALVHEQVSAQQSLDQEDAALTYARAMYGVAEQTLRNFGYSQADLDRLDASGNPTGDLKVRAPLAGTIVSRTAVQGAATSTTNALFEIANLDEMWVELAVPIGVASSLHKGTVIHVSTQSDLLEPIEGVITWVSPLVDETTRLVRVRGVMPNAHGHLRQSMFVDVLAHLENHPNAVQLPATAVHRVNEGRFVFVREEGDLFAARRVALGTQLPSGDYVVEKGIHAGDDVVLDGGFTIKSVLLASRLGAGCTDH